MSKDSGHATSRIDMRGVLDVVLAVLGLAVAFVCHLHINAVDAALVSWVIVALSLYACVAVRKNRLLLLLFGIILYANYSICFANYINPVEGVLATSLADTSAARVALLYLLVFMSILVGFLPKKVNQYSYGSPCFTGYKENSSIAVLLLMLLLLICIFGFTRPDSLGAERGSSSSLYEYSIILFILVFYFSNQKKWLTILSLTVLALFVLQDIAYGGRITAIQLLVVAFFFVFNKDTKSSILLAIVACLLIFFISFGGVRTQVWEDGLTALLDSFQNILDTGLAWDTAYSAWHTSITFIQFDSLVSPSEHMYYVGQWLLSLVLGGSAVADSNLAAVTHLYFAHSYGGILPVYLAFYFGVPGIIAIAFLVSAFVSLVNRFCMKSDLTFNCWQSALRLGMLYFVATAPRWFIYSPSQLIRGLALMLILSFVVLLINEMMNKREEHKTTNRVLRSSVKDEHI